MDVFKTIVTSFFPNKCICCGEVIGEDEYFCDYCYGMLEQIDCSKNCKICGLPKKDCNCKYHVFHFNRCIAPFENEGTAKEAIYRCKFAKWKAGYKFFAERMSIAVKTYYNDVDFDGVAYVPMRKLKKLKRGFNQAEELAIGMGNILDIPVFQDVLFCAKGKQTQHNLKYKERFENVKGRYGYNYSITGKTVLLVDDIKTTGASLDECAKQLVLAGASKVYCVTGVMTNNRKEEKKNGFGYWYRFGFFKNRNIFKFKGSA